MHWLRLRFPFVLLASAFSVSAAALAEPPSAPPAPEPMPYPNTTTARDAASGLATGKRMHKPYTVKVEPMTLDVREVTWTAAVLQAANRLSSDPEEGGQVARGMDVAGPKLAAPADSGTATVTVARGACATGKHFPVVKIVARSGSYTLHDVDAGRCTDSGNTTTCVLTYRSLGT